MAKCKACGAELKPYAKFCKICGSPADHSEVPTCSNCGFELKANDKFCKKCGTPVTQSFTEVKPRDDSANFDYRKDYDKLYDDTKSDIHLGDHIDEEIKKMEAIEKSLGESRKGSVDRFEDEKRELEERFKEIKWSDDSAEDRFSTKVIKRDEFKKEIKAEEPSDDALIGIDEGDSLEVPSFFKKSKSKIDDAFKTSEIKSPIGMPKDEVPVSESDEAVQVQTDNKHAQDNKDYTMLLPGNLDELESQIKNNDRAVLSEEKKKLIKKSKEIKNDINHDLTGDKPVTENTEKTSTQKIKLDHATKPSLEERKVIDSGHSTRKRRGVEDKAESKDNVITKVKPSLAKYIIPILVVVALFSVFYATMQGLTDKKRVIAKFEEAVLSNKASMASSLMQCSDPELSVNPKSIEPFIKLMNTDQIYKSSLMGAIKEDSSKLSIDKKYESARSYKLQNVGKKMLLFDDYKIVIDPILLNLSFDETGPLVFNNDDLTTGVEGMKILPGIYEAHYKDKPESIYTINISNTNEQFTDGTLTVKLAEMEALSTVTGEIANTAAPVQPTAPEVKTKSGKWEGETEFHIDAVRKDAVVYINGESTGLTVEDYNKIPLKSVVSGDKVKIAVPYPWGEAFSNEVTLSGETLLSLFVDIENDQLRDHIINRVEKMLKEDSAARQNMNMSGFTTIVEPELSTTADIIHRGVESGLIYYRVYETMSYDPDSFSIEDNGDGTMSGYIGGLMKYKATEYPQGGSLSDVGAPAELEQIVGFHLTFLPDKNDWFVNMWGTTERYIELQSPIVHNLSE